MSTSGSPLLERPIHSVGRGIRAIERVGLMVILAATVVAMVAEILHMLGKGKVDIADLLLLFMYLEMVALVGMYWRKGKMPVRMPLYIAMVGVARHMMTDTSLAAPMALLAGAGTILVLAVAVLVVRYGHARYPYGPDEDL
ncbi:MULTISPECIES: phosphate-starvation-inducible protein PsiE [Thermomonas]|uniref:Protein PsiE n=1 Tax=Thermomonas hydrothermalis TaxID=213588 RepID=A0A1M5AFR2_9GAMM|nr:phosphate-starvation-inducible PsiE family protein [Thermomonas hydrothermalis]MCL6618964.1 phosphate-starvation-inducible PsiE family protein [Thermomonas hydrothermalis]SHF28997.1 protein PsiE [Thermomonas hydrothermalis]